MRIISLQSPHKSNRTRTLESIEAAIIHYTGSMSLDGTLDWFSTPRKDDRVSAHIVLGRAGEVYAFDTLRHTLWHAGKSEWLGKKWCNYYSIGYELVGTFKSGFTVPQMDNLLELLYGHTKITGIKYILGHEHVSAGRKIDPGPLFNWNLVRASHRETPLLNMHGKPVEYIGAYPTFPPMGTDKMGAGDNGAFAFLSPMSQRMMRLIRIQGRES